MISFIDKYDRIESSWWLLVHKVLLLLSAKIPEFFFFLDDIWSMSLIWSQEILPIELSRIHTPYSKI